MANVKPPAANPPSFMELSDEEFLATLQTHSKFKQRSHTTHHTVHIPELNHRLGLNLSPSPETSASTANTIDPFAPKPDLSNTYAITTIYMGNSMLERLKTTGASTQPARLETSWNAGVGGDTSEKVNFRLTRRGYTHSSNNTTELRTCMSKRGC